ncbi:hypothetical protein P692DRAFT_20756070, partial [Suillus brevipes Sb2]
VRPPVNRVPQCFFNGVSPSHFSAQIHTRSSALLSSTLLERFSHRSLSNTHDTSPSSSLDWARNFSTRRGQSSESTELQGRGPAVVEVPCAPGQRRNACAREKRKRLLPLKNPIAGSSHPPEPNVTDPSLQSQAADSSSSATPAIGDATTITGTTSMPSRPDITIKQAGLWTRFWLLICCASTEHTDGHHYRPYSDIDISKVYNL